MDVLLVRHATAVSATGRLRDEERWLTEEGRDASMKVGARLAELGVRPTVVYTSPLVRAVQTTELLVQGLATVAERAERAERAVQGVPRVSVHPPLAIDTGSTAEVLSILERHVETDTLVLVTHEPKIRALASKLARIPRFPGFTTAGSALFRGPRDALQFVWSLDPGSLATSRDPLEPLG